MKKILLIGIALMATVNFVNAQSRNVTRGEVGEMYLSGYWYGNYNPDWGPPVFDTLLKALYHITDYGKKATLQYYADVFIQDEDYPYFDSTVTVPAVIIADATPGVLYNRDSRYSSKLGEWRQSLWVSFDYGQTWTFREQDRAQKHYKSSNFEGLIYRAQGMYENGVFKSTDYGETWQLFRDFKHSVTGECGLDSCELFGITGSSPEPWMIYHTYDWYETYTITPIDKQYVFGNMSGIFPDVYRGALPGEVYVSSWFPDWTYKISFSADTGHTFRVVYHSDSLYFANERQFFRFMSDREAGVFYIIYGELVEIDEPWGIYEKVCISHYADYGETLVGTYCHDLMMHYPESCAGVLDMEAKVQGNNNVALQWSPPQAEQPVAAYYVYRNDTLMAVLQQTDYLDEDLPNGKYTYHVRVMYADGCESLSYNTVKVVVDFTGIGNVTNAGGIIVYPNPTNGMINVQCLMINVQNVEVFDLMGRKVFEQKAEGAKAESRRQKDNSPPLFPSFGGAGVVDGWQAKPDGVVINISHLPPGLYFVRITTENSVVVRKVVKQ